MWCRYSGKSGVFDSLDSGAEGATSMDTDSESSAATQPGAPARCEMSSGVGSFFLLFIISYRGVGDLPYWTP